jgi:NADP-dependent 3-hydroxy acid dehydrogenase YdfG
LKAASFSSPGASSGIGEAAARLFAAEGAQVVLAARRAERIEATAAELRRAGLSAAPVACDVRDEGSVAAAVAFAVSTYGRLDGAFNNAGVGGARGPVHEVDADVFDKVIATNLRGVLLCMKHEIAAMLDGGGGAVVNTSSIGGLVGAADNSVYAASKWGWLG